LQILFLDLVERKPLPAPIIEVSGRAEELERQVRRKRLLVGTWGTREYRRKRRRQDFFVGRLAGRSELGCIVFCDGEVIQEDEE